VSANHGVATPSVQPHAPPDGLGPRSGAAVTFATTEHFNLQTARALTVSEANGRASIYLAALSSNLIALAFIGQMSRLGMAFYAFALILLPVLAFVAFSVHEHQHRRARDTHCPEAVDQAAILISPPQPADVA
jgi:hypothetical protein